MEQTRLEKLLKVIPKLSKTPNVKEKCLIIFYLEADLCS